MPAAMRSYPSAVLAPGSAWDGCWAAGRLLVQYLCAAFKKRPRGVLASALLYGLVLPFLLGLLAGCLHARAKNDTRDGPFNVVAPPMDTPALGARLRSPVSSPGQEIGHETAVGGISRAGIRRGVEAANPTMSKPRLRVGVHQQPAGSTVSVVQTETGNWPILPANVASGGGAGQGQLPAMQVCSELRQHPGAASDTTVISIIIATCAAVEMLRSERANIRSLPAKLVDETGPQRYYANRDAATYARAFEALGMSMFSPLSIADARPWGLTVCLAMNKIGATCLDERGLDQHRLVSQFPCKSARPILMSAYLHATIIPVVLSLFQVAGEATCIPGGCWGKPPLPADVQQLLLLVIIGATLL